MRHPADLSQVKKEESPIWNEMCDQLAIELQKAPDDATYAHIISELASKAGIERADGHYSIKFVAEYSVDDPIHQFLKKLEKFFKITLPYFTACFRKSDQCISIFTG